MKRNIVLSWICLLILAFGQGHAEDAHDSHGALDLSPEVLDLLRSEMREIAGGMQAIAYFIATAEWKSIHETSVKIHASYIMDAKLTPDQSRELNALPERFKTLDASFHQRAQKLGEAAHARDGEFVAYHYGRMLESCVVCHAEYARNRFPAFSPPIDQTHHHH